MERLLERPWWVIFAFVLCAVAMATRLSDLVVDPQIKSQMPPDLPALHDLYAIQDRFGGSETVILAVQAPDVLEAGVLEQVRALSLGLAGISGVEQVHSLFTVPQVRRLGGVLDVGPAVQVVPDPSERDALAAMLRENGLVYGNLVSRDFTATAVVGVLAGDSDEAAVMAAVRAMVRDGPATVLVGGMPEVRTRVSTDIRQDMNRFLPFGLLVIFGFLYVCFRQLRGVLLPVAVVAMSVVFAMAMIPVLGWKLQLITNTLPIVLLAVANDYSIHLVSRYQEDNDGRTSAPELARKGVRSLGRPVVAAGLTTMAGLLCLQTHVIVPAAQLGVLAAFGVGYALLCSLLFVPAVLAVLPVPPPIPRGRTLETLLDQVARGVAGRPRVTLAVAAVAVLAASAGLPWLSVDTNPVHYYAEGAPLRQTTEVINREFGGSTELMVMFEDVRNPATQARIEGLHEALSAHEHVGYVVSIVTVAGAVNRAMGKGDTSDAVELLYLLHELGGATHLDRILDFDDDTTLLTARIDSLTTSDITEVVHATQDWLGDAPGVTVSGFGVLFTDLVDALVRGQFTSLGLALSLVFLLVVLTFRSVLAGAYAVLPLALAIPTLFGLMGTLGIELNAVTALLSSIMIGVGVDYTIHFLWSYRVDRQAGMAPEAAVHHTLTTAGRGIVFNALSVVVGFSVLFVSAFQPVQFFGFLVVVSITACLLGALVLLPALVLVTRPRFLE